MEQNKEPNSSFNTKQYDAAYAEGVQMHYWQIARSHIVYKLISQLKLTTSKVMEVGCGRGFVVKALRSKGIDVRGVEVANVEVVADVREFISVACDAGSIPEPERASIEVLLLLDVIEHIESPETFLVDLIDSYPNVRMIILTVPARQEIWSEFDEYYGHFRRYDLAEVAKYAKKTETILIKKRYFFHSLYLVALALKILGIKRRVVIAPPSEGLTALHKLMAGILKVEYFFGLGKLPGSSLLFALEVPPRIDKPV